MKLDDDAEDNTEQLALPKACGRTMQYLDGLLKEVDSATSLKMRTPRGRAGGSIA
jgi:hypothetical protein